MNNIIFLIGIGVLGLIIGSFLNVVIYRLPLMLQQSWRQQCLEFLKHPAEIPQAITLATPRSHCPKCKQQIGWLENIPLISFFGLKGKCRHCGYKISWRYPIVEFCSALLAVLTAYHFGITWQTAAALILTWSLIVLFFIDQEHLILPDEITLGLLWLGLLLSLFYLFTTPENAIIGAASAYIFLWLIGWGFKKIRGIEGIGYGDYKLFAAFGAWLGWQALPLIIVVASLIGVIAGLSLIFRKKIKRQTPIPFGPFLAIAGWIILVYGSSINILVF